MSYVVYHKDTTRYLRSHKEVRTNLALFATERAAKAALTREVNSGAVKREDFLITSRDDFEAVVEKTETVKSLMTGSDVKQCVNTPLCCDPSSETYWSL